MMSVGSISSSGFEAMRARFESFRSGSTKIQKTDLEEAKATVASRSSSETGSSKEATKSQGIDELIEKFSQIDTNGDGISADELDSAVQAGTITQPQGGGGPGGMKGPPPGGPPPGGPPPGGKGGAQKSGGTSQSDLMAYDLFEEFKKKLQADSAVTATTSVTSATESSETDETSETDDSTSSTESTSTTDATNLNGKETLDLLAMWGKKSANAQSDPGASDSGSSKGKGLAASLIQQLLKSYQQQASGISSEAVSSLGAGVVA